MKIRYWIAAVLCIATSAWATPLVTYTHDYSSTGGSRKHPVTYDYVTVKENGNSGTTSFSDAFDFSTLDFASIERFELTLNYAQTDSSFEDWKVRVGARTNAKDYGWGDLDWVGQTPRSTTFVIYASASPLFQSLLRSEDFSLWFAEDSWFDNSFRLYSAALTIYGEAEATVPVTPTQPTEPTITPIPEPASLALLGIGLAGLGLRRRERKNG